MWDEAKDLGREGKQGHFGAGHGWVGIVALPQQNKRGRLYSSIRYASFPIERYSEVQSS